MIFIRIKAIAQVDTQWIKEAINPLPKINDTDKLSLNNWIIKEYKFSQILKVIHIITDKNNNKEILLLNNFWDWLFETVNLKISSVEAAKI